MNEKAKEKRERALPRPVYKTSFHIVEELYESPEAKNPLLFRTVKGSFSVDLLKMALAGVATLSALALALLLSDKRR